MLTIGDFARYAGVSVRMLRHYDALGLVTPSAVDPSTGYRRYDAALLPRVHRLVALRELGFGLEEIGDLLADDLGPELLRERLSTRRDELAAQIARDHARLAEVERRLRLIEGGPVSEQFQTRSLPQLTLTQLTAEVDGPEEVGRTIGPMYGYLAGLYAAAGADPGLQVAWYAGDGERLRFGAGFAGELGTEVDRVERGTIAGAEDALVLTHRGPVTSIQSSWEALGAELARRGLDVGRDPCREVYVELPSDPTDLTSPDWVIELQQPVRT